MKKTLILSKRLCLLAVLFLAGVFSASAADFMVDSICYNVIGDNAVEVTKRDVKYSGEVFIPATVVNDGTTYQVTRIGDQAFSSCNELTLIDIPEGVTEIGQSAFYDCYGLTFIEFPNSLLKIGDFAFYNCYNFTYIYIPRNVASIGCAFPYCEGVTSYVCSGMNAHYTVVDGVLYSKDMTRLVAFPLASSVTVFNIPESVTIIDNMAFAHAYNLTEINMSDNITWIGYSVFRGCTGLTSLVLSDGITHMGPSDLAYCSNLTYVHLPASLDTLANATFYEVPALTEVTIPRNVKFIDNFAFAGARAIKNIIFEKNSCLEAIGLRSFEDCISLETFDMPNSVTRIDAQIFGNCTALKSVHLSDNLTYMDGATFYGCSALLECYIPSSVRVIPNACFGRCTSLKSVKIGEKDATPGGTLMVNSSISSGSALKRLELGANVDSLTSSAIANHGLKVVICWPTTPPRCNGYWSPFSPNPVQTGATLYVPRVALEAYSTTAHWKDFPAIVPIEDLGDVNGDGSVNISDVTALINMLLSHDFDRQPYADINLDGSVNITDVTALINRLLSGE